jgi:hypothetical protein
MRLKLSITHKDGAHDEVFPVHDIRIVVGRRQCVTYVHDDRNHLTDLNEDDVVAIDDLDSLIQA